jgi:hypothetical protein
MQTPSSSGRRWSSEEGSTVQHWYEGGSGDSFVIVAAQIKKYDDYSFKGHIIGTCSYFDADSHTNTHSGTHTPDLELSWWSSGGFKSSGLTSFFPCEIFNMIFLDLGSH